MKRCHFKIGLVLTTFVYLLVNNLVFSQNSFLIDREEVGWFSYRDMTSNRFNELASEIRRNKQMIIDFEAYLRDGKMNYAMVGFDNTDNRGWEVHRDLTSAEYGDKWTQFTNRGWRQIDIEIYKTPNGIRYGGIWIENKEGLSSSSNRNYTKEQYENRIAWMRNNNMKLIDLEVYLNSNNVVNYAMVWVENTDNRNWVEFRNMNRDEYQSRVDYYANTKYAMTDFEALMVNGVMQYAAIWEELPKHRAMPIRTNRTADKYREYFYDAFDEGYRQVDLEVYDTPSGLQYAGVWIENSFRLRYKHKKEIDEVVEAYLEEHKLPAISVGIMQDGRMVYKRGFGLSDVENGYPAHSQTIYGLASISKTVGGVLSAKYATDLDPSTGQPFLNLDLPTVFYLRCLPRHHTHTVRNLLQHVSGVAHYSNSSPPMPNLDGLHFTRQFDASEAIWDTPLIESCAGGNTSSGRHIVGQSFCYSTHAFTFVGAALEDVTGRSMSELIKRDIANPLGLSSFRVQFEEETLKHDKDRAVPYADDGLPGLYPNISWKILGGGLESNVVDLVLYGDAVRRGSILNARVRDTLLWNEGQAVVTGSGVANRLYGLGWYLGTDKTRRIAQHGGSLSGVYSHLRVYRDDGLTIGILTNRRTGSSSGGNHPLSSLVGTIGDIILNSD